jgi:hypothetical protein
LGRDSHRQDVQLERLVAVLEAEQFRAIYGHPTASNDRGRGDVPEQVSRKPELGRIARPRSQPELKPGLY